MHFHTPCTIGISGVSGSGKTVLTYKIIENKDILFDNKIEKILFCYGIYQDIYQKMERELDIEFHEGLPTEEYLTEFTDGQTYTLIILDDLMQKCVKSPQVELIFTRLSHHRKITVIFINQNWYCQGKNACSISINTHYFFILKNPRDVTQVNSLGRQIGMNKTLPEAYRDAVSKPYGYLLIDLSPVPDIYTLKTNIFPGENQIVYLPK